MKTNNVHVIKAGKEPLKVLLLSDLHWDNPKCDRDLLLKHLNLAKESNCPILLNGDTFCLMQGSYDPRKSKSDIRPEHNVNSYLDAVVNTAIDWFKPYAHLIKVVGYGNHETNILKRQETDVIERFVSGLNREAGTDVQVGGYGGWIVFRFYIGPSETTHKVGTFKLKYFHGAGGAAPVTKGTIQHNRMQTSVEGADAIWMGHVHNDYEVTYTVESLDQKFNVILKDILMIRTSTYKEEYNKGKGGWHVERGASPKPLGGRWLELHPYRQVAEHDRVLVNAFTYRTI
jgi:predicted phosphodiesterase